MTAEYPDGTITRAAPSAGPADAVREALVQAGRGADSSRWPGKLPVSDRLTALLDPDSWVEDGLLANATAGRAPCRRRT